MGGSVRSLARPGDRTRLSRRVVARGRSEARPVLLDVRAEILLDERIPTNQNRRRRAMSRDHLDSTILDRIRKEAPLIHNITNYVVMNWTANALLAAGASPVMAH